MTKKNTNKTSAKIIEGSKNIDEEIKISPKILLGLTFSTAFLYFLYSKAADGFYQQDEAAHFISMLEFWHNPNGVLSNWAKPGYKLIYAFPALLGANFVSLFNCLLAAFSCFFAYKVAEKAGSKIAILAFAATALQPLWINLAFRNYSELLTSFLLILGVYFFQKQKFALSALAVSYVAFIRQETYVILGIYGLYLLWKRQFVPAFLLATFPLFQNFWGMTTNGDPLYLLHQITKQGGEIASAYPRQGFDHYFLMSVTIFGGTVVTLFLAYLASIFLAKKQPVYEILLPCLIYFLLHSIFNLKSFEIGPAGGGNLRYMLVISPLLAILATLAVEQIKDLEKKKELAIFLGIFILLAAIYLTYSNNLVVFKEERDIKPLFAIVLTSFVVFLPLNRMALVGTFVGIMALTSLFVVKPIKKNEEEKVCEQMARWYENYEKSNGKRPLLLHHAMFFYYLNRTSYDFTPKTEIINEKNLAKSPKGSIIIWDSHYSYRPELRKDALPHTYFLGKSDEYRILHTEEALTPDQMVSFAFIIFEKIK